MATNFREEKLRRDEAVVTMALIRNHRNQALPLRQSTSKWLLINSLHFQEFSTGLICLLFTFSTQQHTQLFHNENRKVLFLFQSLLSRSWNGLCQKR